MIFKREYGVVSDGRYWYAFRKHLIFNIPVLTVWVDNTVQSITWGKGDMRQAACLFKQDAVRQARRHKDYYEPKHIKPIMDSVEIIGD